VFVVAGGNIVVVVVGGAWTGRIVAGVFGATAALAAGLLVLANVVGVDFILSIVVDVVFAKPFACGPTAVSELSF
jgi:hypothetical protein